MKRLLLLLIGAAAVGYVLSRRRSRTAPPSENGTAPAGSEELRRFVEASERLRAT